MVFLVLRSDENMKSPKTDKTYQPQFAYTDSEDNEEPLIFSETEATPNESLFIQWCNEQRSAKLPIGFNGGCLTALANSRPSFICFSVLPSASISFLSLL